MSILLYSSLTKLTDDHQPVKCGDKTVYIRAFDAPGVSLLDALDIVNLMEGETFLNSICGETSALTDKCQQ